MAGPGGGGEHRVRIRAHGEGEAAVVVAAAPEARLNRFVRSVALIERLGNALGTLAFTWATVVLLGGYSKELTMDDYWFATVIVFLEATRMFTRNNRLDYQVFFNTRGALRFDGSNGLVVALCFFHVLLFLHLSDGLGILLIAIILATGRFLSGLILRIWHPLHRAMSLWGPLVAILPMAPPLSDLVSGYYDVEYRPIGLPTSWAWVVFAALFVPLLLVTISRLRFTRIVKLVDTTMGSKQVFWRRVTVNLCMIVALGMQLHMLRPEPPVHGDLLSKIIVPASALAVVSFANVQIPAAVLRIIFALLGFLLGFGDEEDNLGSSLKIFYGMVIGQGALYVLAGMIEFFSFIPRRSLVHSGGFRGRWGVESVDLYYAYALEKCMQDSVLAPKKISLSTFAVDSLSSDLRKKKLNGIRMMHSFLQREPTKAQLLSKLNTCAKTVATIVRMLDWKSPADASIRLYAAKVTAQLATNLRLVTSPRTMQLISGLLDGTDSRPKRGNPLLVTDDELEEHSSLNTPDGQEQEHVVVRNYVADNQGQRRDALEDNTADNLLETHRRSTQHKPYILTSCWQRILELCSVPKEEEPATGHDLLPALAMSIIQRLACCDLENCVEISNTANLIPKIIGFTRYRQDINTANTEAQQKILLKSTLKVLQRLTSIDGEIGITLRHKISKHPFLFRNLAEILGDRNIKEPRKLVAGILRNLAVDGNTRQEDIGRTQLTITRLMQAFLSAEGTISTNADHSLRKVAGQALAMLTTESVNNCMVLLKEPEFIRKLKTMILIHDDKYIYVAASLLRNMCLHARTELRDSDLKELSHTLRELSPVLERIIDVEGAELEILIGLNSQICKIIPEDFTRELDDGQIKRRFVKRLIDVLNANTNTEPSPHCPGIRRVILEQVINMAECNYRHTYAECFKEFRMTEALSVVEETLSEAENYRLFLGDAGFMEYSVPISALLARAKELVGH